MIVGGGGGTNEPVPCSEIVVGELGALLRIVTFPENGPAAVGVKIMSKLAVPRCGMLATIFDEGLMIAKGV